MIPLCDLKQHYLSLKTEIGAFCGCRYGIGMANGTDALHLALRALDIGPGDEVITTPFTFTATTEAIGMVGATPVFADIDPLIFNIDPNHIEAAIMDIASRYGLRVVEHRAQAIGATYRNRPVGSFGDAGCLSFSPSKNRGCFGDAGMVVSNNQQLGVRIEILRRHGGRAKYHHEELGLNSRLDELQSAIPRVKLPRLTHWNVLRRAYACRYNALLGDLSGVTRPHELTGSGSRVLVLASSAGSSLLRSVYHQYTIQVEDRDEVARRVTEGGIENGVYYPVPLHRQKVHACLGHDYRALLCGECAARQSLSLSIFPEVAHEQQDHVAAVLRQVCESRPRAGPLRRSA